jgi:hypothetical protein
MWLVCSPNHNDSVPKEFTISSLLAFVEKSYSPEYNESRGNFRRSVISIPVQKCSINVKNVIPNTKKKLPTSTFS